MTETVAPTRAHTPVLMYHSIATRSSSAFRRYCVDPGAFGDHLGALVSQGYHTLTVSELVELRTSGHSAPERSIVLTFDDGFADFSLHALEALTQHGLAATLFIPTAFVGRTSSWLSGEGEGDRPMLGWSALAEISAAGMEIASHSHSHPQLDLLSPAELRSELLDSRQLLEDQLQVEVSSLAYPFGYHTSRVREAARAAGYRSACAVGDLSSTATDDPHALNRHTVSNDMSTEALLRCVAVRTGPGGALRSRARSGASRLVRRTRELRRRSVLWAG